jgi:hypothetical protein
VVIDGISCNLIKPVSELPLIALEAAKIFNNFQENLSRNIFGCMSFKEPMDTIAKYCIIMPAVQLHKDDRIAKCLGYHLAVISCFTFVIQTNYSPEFTGTNYHHY